jgi:hypothetical protein
VPGLCSAWMSSWVMRDMGPPMASGWWLVASQGRDNVHISELNH